MGIIPLPEPGSEWTHTNGNKYTVVVIANKNSERLDKYPVTVVYKGANGFVWSRPLSLWHASMTLRGQPQQDADKVDAQPAASAEPKYQFRKKHCADWYDGHPDHSDGGGPYEVRTLYTAPVAAQPDPAMAGEEWLDTLEDLLLEHIGGYDERKAVMEHARKRVQPDQATLKPIETLMHIQV